MVNTVLPMLSLSPPGRDRRVPAAGAAKGWHLQVLPAPGTAGSALRAAPGQDKGQPGPHLQFILLFLLPLSPERPHTALMPVFPQARLSLQSGLAEPCSLSSWALQPWQGRGAGTAQLLALPLSLPVLQLLLSPVPARLLLSLGAARASHVLLPPLCPRCCQG